MKGPYFSIILPTYNRSELLKKAIGSIMTQTYNDWELIIVDDGSTDDTKAIVETFTQNDPRIKYLYQINSERSAARNNGINNAKGEYVCFLDSADYFSANRLKKMFLSISSTPKTALYYTGISFEKNETITKRIEIKNTY